ncbi:MAG: hypothetical protein JXX14_00640 [Deltaproteobacteria bacterium]|nr:hypothetical protein [Deltaproteobacteria bacterium]
MTAFIKYGAMVLFILTGVVFGQVAVAATYTMTPADDWTVLENAQAGDVVEIAPGTYDFRVHLDNVGTADNPIIIRAQDPANRPVWDLVGDESHLVSDAPGSYTAGDRGRGCWQVGQDGGHYEISGIVFRNCRDSASAGFRAVNSGPVKLTDCLFENNTNGLTGASEDFVVEHCEFRNNGKTFEGGNMTHNIYVFGGRFTMRYCYNHDSHEGQLFHIRAAHSVIEYNWLARPSSYVGDIMSCEYLCDGAAQHMTLTGNVIVQGTPENESQLIALYADEDTGVAEMNIKLYYNTIIGTPRSSGQTHNLLNLRNDSIDTHATLENNIIYNVGSIAELANVNMTNWSVVGQNNWVTAGTDVTYISNSIEGSVSPFTDVANLDFTLSENSTAVGAAESAPAEMPVREYFLNEETICAYRERQTADDLGAFEFGTAGNGIDAYGATPITPPDVDTGNIDTDFTDTSDSDAIDDTESETEYGDTSIEDTSVTADTEASAGDTGSGDDDDDDSNGGDGEATVGSDSAGCGCIISGTAQSQSVFALLMHMLF